MKKYLLFSFCIIISSFNTFGSTTVPEKVGTNQLLNIAGKQRMISQKLAKIYLMKAYGAYLDSFDTEFNTSTIIFERNIETLEANLSDLFSTEVSDEIKKAIKKENRSWKVFKNIIQKPAKESEVRKVVFLSNELLKDCDNLVQLLKAESLNFENFAVNPELIEIVDLAAKQRMGSQRLCLYFVAKQFDLKEEIKSLRDDVSLYSVYMDLDDALFFLLNSPLNTLEIEQAVGKTLLIFENLRTKKDSFLEGKSSLNEVYKITNSLTDSFDDLVLRYTKLTTESKDVVFVK